MNRQRLLLIGIALLNGSFSLQGAHFQQPPTKTASDWQIKSLTKTLGTAFSSGRIAFNVNGNLAAASQKTVTIYDPKKEMALLTLEHPNIVTCLAFSSDGKYLITGSVEGILRCWDLSTKNFTEIFKGDRRITALASHPTKKLLAFGLADGTVRYANFISFSTSSDTLNTNILGEGANDWSKTIIKKIEFDLEDKHIVTQSENGVRLWDYYTNECISQIHVPSDPITCVGPWTSKESILIGLKSGAVGVYNSSLAQISRKISCHTDPVASVVASKDGKFFATSSLDKTIKVWEQETGTCVQEISHTHIFTQIAFDSENNIAAISNGKLLFFSDPAKMVSPWYKRRTTLFGSTFLGAAALTAYCYRASLMPLWGRITSLFKQPTARY